MGDHSTNRFLAGLADNWIQPSQIDLVISTHTHLDHIGNLNLFTNATHLVAKETFKKQQLTFLPPVEKRVSSFGIPE